MAIGKVAVIVEDRSDPNDNGLEIPVPLEKIREVAKSRTFFTQSEDALLAKWILKINDIMILR